MLYAIEYRPNEQGRENIRKSLNEIGGAVIPRGDIKIYFTNSIVAFKAVDYLNQNCELENIEYFVKNITKTQTSKINPESIVETYEQFQEMYNEKRNKNNQNFNIDIQEKNISD